MGTLLIDGGFFFRQKVSIQLMSPASGDNILNLALTKHHALVSIQLMSPASGDLMEVGGGSQ